MIAPPANVRTATSAEKADAIATIVAAFVTDPIARFAWPSAGQYLAGMPTATLAFAGGSVDHGSAYVGQGFQTPMPKYRENSR